MIICLKKVNNISQNACISADTRDGSLTGWFKTAKHRFGLNRLSIGDNKGAIEDYTQAIKINNQYEEYYLNRGNIRYSIGDNKGAIEDYTQAIRLNPKLDTAYVKRGNTRYRIGDKKGAIQDYNTAIIINPNNALAYFNQSIIHYENGDKQGAMNDYNHAIKLNPKLAVSRKGHQFQTILESMTDLEPIIIPEDEYEDAHEDGYEDGYEENFLYGQDIQERGYDSSVDYGYLNDLYNDDY